MSKGQGHLSKIDRKHIKKVWKNLHSSNLNRTRNLPGHNIYRNHYMDHNFDLFCRRCQTGCLGDGDSCNINDDFDNMDSVQMITDIMFKSCLINAVATICLSRYLLIKRFVIKNNPKLLPVIFFQSTVKVKVTGQRSKWWKQWPSHWWFHIFGQKLITKLGSFLFITKYYNLLELEQNISNDLELDFWKVKVILLTFDIKHVDNGWSNIHTHIWTD